MLSRHIRHTGVRAREVSQFAQFAQSQRARTHTREPARKVRRLNAHTRTRVIPGIVASLGLADVLVF